MGTQLINRTFISLLSLTVLISCSKNTPTSVNATYEDPAKTNTTQPDQFFDEKHEQDFDWLGNQTDNLRPVQAETDDQFMSIISNSRISCRSKCTAGVGLLLSYHRESKQVSRCTAFLIQKNVLATNNHCVPKDIKSGQSPLGRIVFLLPGSSHVSLIRVEELIQASNMDGKNQFTQDFALLKINSPQQEQDILKVTRSGVADSLRYTIPHVNQISSLASTNSFDFQVQTVECTAIQRSPIFPFFESDYSKIVTFKNCPIRSGNSGSPILNSDGNVVAILSAYFLLENTPLGRLMKSEDLVKVPRVALATNFSCIQDFKKSTPLNEICNADLSDAEYYGYYKSLRLDALKKETDLDRKKNQESALMWQSLNSEIFNWKIIPKKSDDKENSFDLEFFSEAPLVATLDCINPPKNWIDIYKKYLFFYENKATVIVKTYLWGTMATVDKDFNFKPQPTELNDGELKIIFNPSEIYENGITQVEVVKILEFSNKKIEMLPQKISLSICK